MTLTSNLYDLRSLLPLLGLPKIWYILCLRLQVNWDWLLKRISLYFSQFSVNGIPSVIWSQPKDCTSFMVENWSGLSENLFMSSLALCSWLYTDSSSFFALQKPFLKDVTCLTQDVRKVLPAAYALEHCLIKLYSSACKERELHFLHGQEFDHYQVRISLGLDSILFCFTPIVNGVDLLWTFWFCASEILPRSAALFFGHESLLTTHKKQTN